MTRWNDPKTRTNDSRRLPPCDRAVHQAPIRSRVVLPSARELTGDGPTDRVRACLPHGVGGHRVEADGCALSQWAVDGVAQVENDSIGIVVAGKGVDGLGYILADRTCKLSPDGWGRRAVEAYREFKADRIIAERNFGGAMVRHVIKTVEKSVSYKEVTASRGKIARAEPVAALYEQGRVKHAGSFPELEDEMCAMAPEGYVGDGSPDR